jgi:DNA repair protein RadC
MNAPTQCRLPLSGSMRESDTLEFGNVAEELEVRDRLLVRGDYDELRAATTAEIIAAARRAMTRRVHRGTSMSSPRAVREFLAVKLGTL